MKQQRRSSALLLAALLAAFVAGCAVRPPMDAPAPTVEPAGLSVLRSMAFDRDLEERILALNPERISENDIRTVLVKAPTPRIISVHGGIYPVHVLMESFGQFLTGMGYPEDRIRDPGDGAMSRSPYESSELQAGLIAWHYEHDGVRPMLVGHSQGGIQIIKILHELAGAFSSAVPVYNPVIEKTERRTTIIDPLTGHERPVVGVSVSYASAVGTGGWSLALPVHWMVWGIVRTIPDTVEEFTGYRIALDLFAWDAPWTVDLKTFHANGKATVRNIELPAEYSHVFVPNTAQLAEDKAVRDWLNAFDPDNEAGRAPMPGNVSNVMWAADVWHSIKRHWTLEAQRVVRARRAVLGS